MPSRVVLTVAKHVWMIFPFALLPHEPDSWAKGRMEKPLSAGHKKNDTIPSRKRHINDAPLLLSLRGRDYVMNPILLVMKICHYKYTSSWKYNFNQADRRGKGSFPLEGYRKFCGVSIRFVRIHVSWECRDWILFDVQIVILSSIGWSIDLYFTSWLHV